MKKKHFIFVSSIVLIVALAFGGWFWYVSYSEKKEQISEADIQNQQEQQQASSNDEQSDLPQWEKDALVEREKLGYPPLPESWRLFRSEEYGFEVGYKESWVKDGQKVEDALVVDTTSSTCRFFFLDIRSRKKNSRSMIDNFLDLPALKRGSVSLESIRTHLDVVKEKLINSTDKRYEEVGFVWLTEKNKRRGVLWNDVNGLGTFWAEINTANKEYLFSGNAFGSSGDRFVINPHYEDFIVFLGSFRIIN